MARSIALLSLITSVFFFKINIPRAAILPLLLTMYLIFTDGTIRNKKTSRQFSKYHILFGLWCSVNVGLGLLLYTFNVDMLYILCSLLGFHMLVVWLTLIGKYQDEYTMFHIGYYFLLLIILWYIPMQYGGQMGTIAWLLAPIVTFLLYAGGSFFIHPFVHLDTRWHYRTGIFFIISFLCSIILYFFSIPVLGWTAALVLYTGLTRFIVKQYLGYIALEKRKRVGAEEILAGRRVIQPEESMWYEMQTMLYRIVHTTPKEWKLAIIGFSILFLIGIFINAFTTTNMLTSGFLFLTLICSTLIYYFNITQRSKVNYPTYIADGLLGFFVHAIFARVLWEYSSDNLTTIIFLSMGWTILHQGISVFLAGESKTWRNKRKLPLLYGYALSTAILSLAVMFFITYLGLNPLFTRGLILVYFSIIGTMLYFFFRSITLKNTSSEKTFEV